MPDIYPTGKLQLYAGIKLDNTYAHTLHFSSSTAMENFWSNPINTLGQSLLKHNLTARQYQRVNSGVCEVDLPIDQVYDINYMRFQNTDFSNKWFYAFVLRVEYVNNRSSRIYYEIDVMQTYRFDFSYLPSFIERNHSSTDTPGDNIIEEPVRFGEPIPFAYVRHKFSSYLLCIASSNFKTLNGTRRACIARAGSMYTGCLIDAFSPSDINTFQEALSAYAESQADILNIFIYPSELATVGAASSDTGYRQQITFNDVRETLTKPTSIGSYTPRNKKLLTYPYCYLCVDNGTVTNNYQFEFFASDTFQFIYRGVPMPSPNLYVAPLYYKGVTPSGQQIQPCYEERLELNNLPQIAFPLDSYAAWVAQTQSSRQTKIITGAAAGVGTGLAAGAKLGGAVGTSAGPVGTAVGAGLGAVLGGVLGAIGAKFANDRAMTEAADMKNKSTGTGSGGVDLADHDLGYVYKFMGVNLNDARTIDSFFDMFGYAQNRVMYPQIAVREHWTYLKTNGLNINFHGNHGIPAEDVVKIKQIHDNGVTFWKNHNEVGNYNLSNTIVTP